MNSAVPTPPPPPPRPTGPPSPPKPPARAEATFNSALERPPAEREAYIAQVCGDDTVLTADVRGLLAAHERAGDFLKMEASLSPEVAEQVEAETARLKPEEEGERIGRYKLLQQIGEGGFGSVWMAEQMEPVTRRVALKIIKLGMDTREVIARFEAERQALAMMDHPNIAKVLDAGATDRGRPFFVMELVKGMPITKYCDEAQLGTRERLALFGDVCSAIQHAHQKGIIHRDIKPSNVMVTMHGDKAVVKVIDFGIAKAMQGKLTDKTLFTRFEQFIGTPVYMSPEQAAMSGLDIDTRSDIYALGILLYELLTGKPPFDAKSLASAGYEEMRRIIREVEPPKPSSRLSTMADEERTTLAKIRHIEPEKISRLVEPDLDWIVMKAIEKDRARRYETANGLAQDIQRFLSDEPVSASPPGAGYRFRKFARRNRAALRVATGIVALLVAATFVSSWQAIRATRAEKLAGQRLTESEQARAKAAASEARALESEREATANAAAERAARAEAEAISRFMTAVFQSPDPTRDGRMITLAETFDRAAMKLETELADQPARKAMLQAALGETYRSLGLARSAIPLQEKVRDYYVAVSGSEHPATLSAMGNLANSYLDADRLDEALKLREEVLALSRKILGPKHPNTLKSMSNLGTSYDTANRVGEALKLHEEVLALKREVLGPEDPDTLIAMGNLANSYGNLGRRDEALKLSEEVLPLDRRVNGPEHPSTLKTMNNLANSYEKAGRHAEALKLREEVLSIRRRILGPEHPDTLSAMVNLTVSYDEARRWADSIKLGGELLSLRRKVLGVEHPETLEAMEKLGTSYNDGGRWNEALKLREEVVVLRRKELGPLHPLTLRAMHNLAISYDHAGRLDEALKLREEVLALRRLVLDPDHPDTLDAMHNLAISYHHAGRHDEALHLQEEVLALRRKVLGPEHPRTLGAATNLAMSYGAVGRLPEAIELQEQTLAIKRRVLPPRHSFLMVALLNMADLYDKAGRKDEAPRIREEILALCIKIYGPAQPDTLNAKRTLALSYRANGDVAKAEALEKEIAAAK